MNTYYLEANRKVAGRARHTLKVILPQTGVYPFNACYNLPYYSITEHLYLQPTCDTLLLQVIKILRMYCSATHKSNSSLIQWNEGFLKSKTQLKYSFAFQNTFLPFFKTLHPTTFLQSIPNSDSNNFRNFTGCSFRNYLLTKCNLKSLGNHDQ